MDLLANPPARQPVTPADVVQAARRLAGRVRRTPLVRDAQLDRLAGAEVWLKLENLQHSGSFKFRGAFNALTALTPSRRRAGVLAPSSGNHASAVALAASLLGGSAVALMPQDAPRFKVDAVSALGAALRWYDRMTDDRWVLATEIALAERLVLVPSSDSALVIAGAGSVAMEMLDDVELNRILVPVGGGGLAAGCALAARARRARAAVVGVEPHGADDTARSIRLGRRVSIPAPATIADGLRHPRPDAQPFAVNRRRLAGVALVSDAEIRSAMAFLLDIFGVTAEPSGACALAAVLTGRVTSDAGQRIGVVISGGNVDAKRHEATPAEPEGGSHGEAP